jgi:ATP-dependent DNA helicase RecQ
MTGSIHHTLRTVFGFHEFRSPQQEVIERVTAGEDAFLVMPTGGGKSLCYQIPAIHRPGLAIVVSPLISLMKDQVDGLTVNGVKAAFFNSSLTPDESRRVMRLMETGGLDLLYVAPERLMQPGFLDRIASLDLALFAIDEAHCISQWGHDFRPEYTQLGRLRPLFPGVPMVAMTATADPETRVDIVRQLGIEQAGVYVAGFDRPNITYTVIPKDKPFAQLGRFLSERHGEAGIVYALSRKRVDQVAERLRLAGFAAAPYHAGLPDDERRRVQEAFRRDDLQIVVATVAFGMGIDKPNVRFVVHYDMPKSVESYYQETGRAGRDGMPAEALMLFGMGDIMTARTLIENSENAERVRIDLQKLNEMVAYAEALTCRRRALLAYFGEQRSYDCNACDVCLDPPHRFDAGEPARKALSCVYRVGERFGVRHVIDVLRGAKSRRIEELGHQRLSTYGIGADLSAAEWENIFRQLLHLGYLVQDFTRYGALRLSPTSRPVLRGEVPVMLGMKRDPVRKTPRKTRLASGAAHDPTLFEELRALRKQIADSSGVPAFVVFSDVTLVEMASRMPANEHELRLISGIGDHKLHHYGAPFLALINNFLKKRGGAPAALPSDPGLAISDTAHATWLLCREGLSMADMVARRGLKESTIAAHLESLLMAGIEIDIRRFVDAEKIPAIEKLLEELGGDTGLSPIKERLPESTSYGDIRQIGRASCRERVYRAV